MKILKFWFFLIVTFLFNTTFLTAAGLDLDRTFAPMLRYNSGINVSDIIVQPDGKFIVGGNMYMIDNRQVNSIARYNTDGTFDTTFDAAGTIFNSGNEVYLALQPDGKIIAGSFFSIAGGQTRLRLARLNQNGSFDPSFNVTSILPNAPAVSSVAVQPDGRIIAIIASGFQINNTTQSIARLNSDGSVDSSFVPFNNTFFPSNAYVQPNGKILVVGAGTINGQTRSIARLNADGSLDAAFNVSLNVGGSIKAASIMPDGKILIGGLFSSVSGQTRTNLARLNADGSLDGSFGDNPNRTNNVNRIGFQTDGKVIYVSASSKIFRDNSDGTADADFVTRSRILGDAKSFAVLSDNRVIGGGNVWVSNSTPPDFLSTRYQPLLMLAADGTLSDGFRPNVLFPYALGDVADIAIQPDGKVLIGTALNSDSSTQANTSIRSLARLNPNGTFDSTFAFPTTFLTGGSRVTQIELLADGKILIGNLATGTNRAVARLNSDGTPDTSFPVVTVSGLDQKILNMAVQTDGKILIRGSFTQVNGQARQGLARLNSDGTLDAGFNPAFANASGGTTGIILTGMVLHTDGKIYVTGSFERVNGSAQKFQVRLNSDGSIDLSLLTSAFSSYQSLVAVQPDGKYLLNSNGTFLRFNADGTRDNSFTSLVFYQSANVTGNVLGAIILPNGKIFVYGNFTYINASGNPNAYGYAVLNADGSLDRNSIVNPGALNQSNVLTAARNSDGKIYIGGGFTFVNYISQPALARLNAFLPVAAFTDFDGDGRADASVFRSGTWFINPSASQQSFYGLQFGLSSDKLAPADYDGDGKTDVAVWREAEGNFYILNSSNNSVRIENFGLAGDVLTIGDWDGDGKADISTYREGAQSYFFYRGSLNNPNGNITYLPWGTSGDKSVRGDFDGDGKMDAAILRSSNNTWYIRNSSDNSVRYENWGLATDKLVPADYDGDGKTDPAVFRNGVWYIKRSSTGQPIYVYWGIDSDQLTPADYNGDGKTDPAVYRNGVYHIFDSTTSTPNYRYFGAVGDIAIGSAFIR